VYVQASEVRRIVESHCSCRSCLGDPAYIVFTSAAHLLKTNERARQSVSKQNFADSKHKTKSSFNDNFIKQRMYFLKNYASRKWKMFSPRAMKINSLMVIIDLVKQDQHFKLWIGSCYLIQLLGSSVV